MLADGSQKLNIHVNIKLFFNNNSAGTNNSSNCKRKLGTTQQVSTWIIGSSIQKTMDNKNSIQNCVR
ncbi:MAG: hypothetical protein ACK56I_22280, partial [bacterium]